MAGDILKEVLPYLQIFPNNGEGSEETSIDPGNYQWGAEPETNEDGTPIANEDIENNEIVDEAEDGYEDTTEEYYSSDSME